MNKMRLIGKRIMCLDDKSKGKIIDIHGDLLIVDFHGETYKLHFPECFARNYVLEDEDLLKEIQPDALEQEFCDFKRALLA